jgi:mono/diheme cytochrome c family protein
VSRLRIAAVAGLGALGVLGVVGSMAVAAQSDAGPVAPPPAAGSPPGANAGPHGDRQAMLTQYCGGCHNDRLKTAGFTLASVDANDVGGNIVAWEKVLRRVSLGEMPPKGMRRPTGAELSGFTGWLETSLDRLGAEHPDPGRAILRRLNRAEYSNAVRDLLDIDVDLSTELPADDSGYGFDNIAAVLSVSPTLLDRYVSVGGKVSRLALGQSSSSPFVTEFVAPKELNMDYHGLPSFNERASDALPLGSRGGAAFKYYAPYDGNYVLQVVLNANTIHDRDVWPQNVYEMTVPLKAGDHLVGAAFKKTLALEETTQKLYSGLNGSGFNSGIVLPTEPPKPLQMNFVVDGIAVKSVEVPSYSVGVDTIGGGKFFQANFLRDVIQVAVKGPYDVKGPGDTPSRRKVFVCQPSGSLSETACAQRILSNLARRAYRRPVNGADLTPLMKVYARGRADGDFEQGIGLAVQAILVSPHFLFVQETLPKGSPGSLSPISDVELATRLSLFLWSSIPDDALLRTAEKGQLRNPTVLQREVTRMLADPKSQALAENFAGQWLYLRNLEHQRPDDDAYPQFDERLRKAMLGETQAFVMSVFRENSSVLDFLNSDYTFLNERLAQHYGIPGVYGPNIRKVSLPAGSNRGGLLGQAGVLTVTSYNNRTSVVKRGHWILDNILAAPPPPPPPDIPAIVEVKAGRKLSSREQIEMHRANPVCASCHSKMDPLGFALENYDAIGGWRDKDAGSAVDASAVLPDGTEFSGLAGLKTILLSRKDQFVEAYTMRLMTYALGRGVDAPDMPAVRQVRRAAARDGYRSNAVVMAIVQSVPFQKRAVPTPAPAPAQRIAQR